MRGRREERGPGPGPAAGGGGPKRYQMREKMFTIGDDFWIEEAGGRRAYKIDGKALRARKTLIFEDPTGRELLKIQEKLATVRDSMAIEDAAGHQVAIVKKDLVSPVRDRLSVTVTGGQNLDVQGNLVDHAYKITAGRDRVAEISKAWFRVRDTYGVEIDAGQNEILMLAITVCVDELSAG